MRKQAAYAQACINTLCIVNSAVFKRMIFNQIDIHHRIGPFDILNKDKLTEYWLFTKCLWMQKKSFAISGF